MSQVVQATARVGNRLGLHARPSSAVVHLAATFTADLHIAKGDLEVSAKSIMGVLMLAAEQGVELTIRGRGEDAPEAVAALAALIERGFDEEERG
jgi:phosphocarrier protein HPr